MAPILDNKELLQLNQLFADLYQDDHYEKAFTTFLEALKELVDFQKGDVYFYENAEGKHIDFNDFIFVDWGDDMLESYLNDYVDLDDALPIVSTNQPVMFRSSDVFLPDERMKTKYYQELLHPAGMEYSIEGNLFVDGDSVAGIGIHRPDDKNDFTQKELEILKLARPHLANVAKRYLDNRAEVDVYAAMVSALYDISGFGVCILDDNMKILDSNLDKSDFVQREHLNDLMRSLIILCRNLMAKMDSDGVPQDVAERKVHSRITIGKETYYVEVLFKPGTAVSGNRFVATVYNCNDIFDKFLYEIRDRYNLTEREYEILKLAIRGESNEQISKTLYISVPTVKKHLTNLYTKLGIEGKHQILSSIMG